MKWKSLLEVLKILSRSLSLKGKVWMILFRIWKAILKAFRMKSLY